MTTRYCPLLLRACCACLAIVLSAGLAYPLSAAEDEDGFVSLFNGKDLDNWVNINGHPETWSVRDGVIYCTGEPIAMLRTKRHYQNFIIELEWRHLKPKGNAGVFVWCDPLPAVGTPFLRGIEVQILDGREADWYTSDGDVFPTWGATMEPENHRGGMRAFPTEKRVKPSPEWNHYRVTCIDGEISLAVNGKVVTRGKNCTPRKGYISLESEGSPTEMRNIRIKELPDSPVAPEMIADEFNGLVSIFNHLDLAGWKTDSSDSWKEAGGTLTGDAKSADQSPTIATANAYGDFELRFDWRWPAKPGKTPAAAELHLGETPLLKLNAETGGRKQGQWNRYHVWHSDGKLTVVLNDEKVVDQAEVDIKSEAPLRVVAVSDTIELRNIFLKEADAAAPHGE